MKKLLPYSQNVLAAHRKCCHAIVDEKLAKLERAMTCPRQRQFVRRIMRFVGNEDGFVASTEELMALVREIEGKWYYRANPLPPLYHAVNEKLHNVFDYDAFAKRKGTAKRGGGVPLMRAVLARLRYCPYCNADMIYTIDFDDAGNPIKSDFDHFFPRSRYPFLALSLYNLIPACNRCNSRFKLAKYRETWKTFHPHLDDVDEATQFVLVGLTNEMRCRATADDDLSIYLRLKPSRPVEDRTRLINYQYLFKIDEVYSQLYNDQALRMLHLGSILNSTYLDEIKQRFERAGKSVDAAKLLLDMPLQRSEIDRHHIGKLKLDILEHYCGINIEQ